MYTSPCMFFDAMTNKFCKIGNILQIISWQSALIDRVSIPSHIAVDISDGTQ